MFILHFCVKYFQNFKPQISIPLIVVLVDDDPLNNLLSKTVIKQVAKDANIFTFTDAQAGLDFVSNTMPGILGENPLALLLLDIEIPVINGWKFLEEFEKLNVKVKKHLHIFMLSSSILLTDKEKALKNRFVIDFIEKPLTIIGIKSMLDQIATTAIMSK